MRDSLLQMGIRKAHPHPSITGVYEALVAQPPDLVVVDIDTPEIDGFKLIRWLRNDPSFGNPFICIVATTWQPTEALMQRANNSGTDALLVKPASPKQLMDRITALVEARKSFVVTADYAGPDRRKNPREGLQIPTLEPPNILRMKATGQWDRARGRDAVAKGAAWLNEQRAARNAFQISFLIAFAEPGLAANPPDRLALDHVLRITPVVEDLLKRVVGRGLDARFDTACKAILALVERIRRSPETPPAAADLTQMRALGLNIMRVLSPDRPADALAREVAEAAQGYRKRLAQIMAAKAAAETEAAAKASS
jgi:CheY-like chemotaxis protein